MPDIPGLTTLWGTAFGDSPAFIDFFLRQRFSTMTPIVCEKDGVIVSALYLMPGVMRLNGIDVPAYYLYAAATLPQARNKGYMGRLLRYAIHYAEEHQADYITLVPANNKLYSYYRRFGFQTFFKKKTAVLCEEDLPTVHSNAQTVLRRNEDFDADIAALYAKEARGRDGFFWDADAVRFAAKVCRKSGGNVVLCTLGQQPIGYAFYYEEDRTVEVTELGGADDVKAFILSDLIRKTPAETMQVTWDCSSLLLPDKSCIVDKGMALQIKGDPALLCGVQAQISMTLE